MSREPIFEDLVRMWDQRDPVPRGLVERMVAVATAEAAVAATDLDYELMLLVERTTELAGTRGTMAYTLRFAAEALDLLVRAGGSSGEAATRLDGWIVPPGPVTVRASQVGGDERSWETEVDTRGRFELAGLPPGLYRLWLTPHEPDATAFGTPTFEI